jgi:hypothetical protein
MDGGIREHEGITQRVRESCEVQHQRLYGFHAKTGCTP